MADTLLRSRPTSADPHSDSHWPGNLRLTLSGTLAAAGAVVLGLLIVELIVLVLWAADPRSAAGASSAVHFAGALWLLAQHGGFATSEAQIGLPPLGLTVLPFLLTMRAGRRVCDAQERPALMPTIAAVAVPYSILAGIVAVLTGNSGLHPHAWQAVLGALALSAAGAGLGAWREMRYWNLAPQVEVPDSVRIVATCGAVAGGVVLAAGALVWGISLALHGSQAAAIMRTLHPGASGATGLLMASLVLVPNAAIWGATVTLGTGFSIGAGSSVGPFGVSVGDVPALPLLAALPHNGVPPWYAGSLMAVPVFAGVVAGVLLVRRMNPASRFHAAGWGALVAVPVALGAFILTALSGGPAGPGRLQTVGASPWSSAAAAAVDIGIPAALTAWIFTWWRHRRAAGATEEPVDG
jgi:hypothetical protein